MGPRNHGPFETMSQNTSFLFYIVSLRYWDTATKVWLTKYSIILQSSKQCTNEGSYFPTSV
jgi:hypothetical protein